MDQIDGARTRRWRAAFAGTLALVMATGTFAPFAVGALGPFLVEDFGLSRAQLGTVVTVLFAVGAICSVFLGQLVDRIGGRRMLVATFALAGVTLLVMAAAPTYPWLLAGAALGGVVVAATNPVTNQLIGAHITRGSQGAIMGVKQSGVQLAGFLAGALLPAGAVALGWRGALAAAAAAPLAATVLVWWVVPRGAGPEALGAAAEGRGAGRGASAVSYRRLVQWLATYALLMGAGVATVTAYLPLYGVEELGLSPTTAGLVAASVGFIGVGSRIAWARGSERHGAVHGPLRLIALLSVVAIALVWAAATAGSGLVWLGAVMLGGTAVSWNAIGMLAIVREVDRASTGTASGVVLVGFYLGYIIAPVSFGWSVDRSGGYGPGWAAIMGLFALAALVAHRRPAPSA